MALKETEKKVIVITINYNHSKDTISCLESILKSSYDNYLVLVIDNGSEISDYNILKNKYASNNKVGVIRLEKNSGYVGGVNKGLEEASKNNPDYYLIMNNDTVIDKIAISELVKTAEKYSGKAIVSGKVYNMDEPDSLQYIGQYTANERKLIFNPYINGEREKDIGKYEKEMELGMADDIFWLLPNKIFKKIGYYSKYFFLYGEQNDYALRVKKEGYKLIYTPKAKLWHIEHLTTGNSQRDSLKVKYWQLYSSFVLCYLHMSRFLFFKIYFRQFFKINFKYIIHISYIKQNLFWEANFKAFWLFTIWLINKSENKGFNPYK